MLRMAVIGAGNIGFHHCRVVSSEGSVRLGAVIDTDLEKARACAYKFGGEAFVSIEDALAVMELDAAIVATPTQTHDKVVFNCLKHNLHVLVEKPAAANPDDARLMMRDAIIRHRILVTGQVERFNPAVVYLKKMILDGELGQIINLVSQRVGGFPQGNPKVGALADLGIHDLDVFYYLLGCHPRHHKSSSVSATGRVEDAATLFLDYGYTSGFIQVNWVTPVKIRRLSVTGTLGYAELNYIAQEIRVFKRNVDPANFSEANFEEFYRKYAQPEADLVQIKGDEPLLNQLRAFLKDIREGHHHHSVPISDVIPSMEIIHHYENQH